MQVRFRPKARIKRPVKSRGGRELEVVYPSAEYWGDLTNDGAVFCDCAKYPGLYEFDVEEVHILKTPPLFVPKSH